ncbi:MAG TPA: DUF445 family protein [Stenomitos sp.]
MLDSPLLHEFVLAIIIGGLTGRLVDFMAVQLLFRPHTPKKIGPLTLHGVLPARQEALARQVANAVGGRLLSEETLTAFISSPEMAAKIRENVHSEVDRFVDRDLPSIRELLGELLNSPQALDEEIKVLSGWFGEYLATLASNPEIRERATGVIARLILERKHMRMEEIVAPGLMDAIERFLKARLRSVTDHPQGLADSLDRWLSELGSPGTLFSEQAQTTFRREAKEKMPEWLKALEDTLRRKETQEWLDRYVLDSVEGFIEDLPRQGFLGELVGWFIRSTYRENKPFYRKKLLEILPGQVERFRESLKDPENRLRLNHKIDQAFDEIFTVPLGKRYELVPPELRRDFKGFVAQVVSSEAAQTSLEQLYKRLLDRFKSAEVAEFLPPSWRSIELEDLPASPIEAPLREVVDFGFDLLLESGLKGQLQTMMTQGAIFVMSRPIGRLRDRLGGDRLARIHGTIETQVLAAAQREAPRLARLIDVRALVESKIRGADAEAIEVMVKNLARKELNSIFTKGLYGGIVVSLVLTTALMGLDYAANRLHPNAGLIAITGVGAFLLVLAARRLRIPAPPSET